MITSTIPSLSGNCFPPVAAREEHLSHHRHTIIAAGGKATTSARRAMMASGERDGIVTGNRSSQENRRCIPGKKVGNGRKGTIEGKNLGSVMQRYHVL